jgi:hypothetical protein
MEAMMGLPDAEIPGAHGGPEGLPTVTRLNRRLYELAFWFLGITLLVLVAGWIWLSLGDRPVPDGIPVVIATIVGGLVGVISTNKQAS